MRFIRTVFVLIIVAVIGVLAYNYWSGHGLTLRPSGSTGVDAEAARDQAKAIVDKTAATVDKAATKLDQAVEPGTRARRATRPRDCRRNERRGQTSGEAEVALLPHARSSSACPPYRDQVGEASLTAGCPCQNAEAARQPNLALPQRAWAVVGRNSAGVALRDNALDETDKVVGRVFEVQIALVEDR